MNKHEKIKVLEQRIKTLENRQTTVLNQDTDIEAHIQRLKARKQILEQEITLR
jgi:hypothetical protein